MLVRHELHLSVEKLPQQELAEHIVFLELVEVREPELPFDVVLRRDPELALGDLPDLFVSPLRNPTDSKSGGGTSGDGSVGRTGSFPVVWSGTTIVMSESLFVRDGD